MTKNTNDTNIYDLMWVEKYSPKKIEQIVNQKDIIRYIKK